MKTYIRKRKRIKEEYKTKTHKSTKIDRNPNRKSKIEKYENN